MLDQTAMENVMMAWIRDRLTMDKNHVIPADENAPQPKQGKFITVKLASVDRVGRDQAGPTDDDGNRIRIGNREIVATIQGYRDGSREALDSLADSLEEQPIRDALRGAGLVIWDIGNVMNMTLPIEDTMRQHYVLEVFLRSHSQRTEAVGFIAQVELEETTESANSADIVEEVTIGNPPE